MKSNNNPLAEGSSLLTNLAALAASCCTVGAVGATHG